MQNLNKKKTEVKTRANYTLVKLKPSKTYEQQTTVAALQYIPILSA